MDISELSEQEKSSILAKLSNWQVVDSMDQNRQPFTFVYEASDDWKWLVDTDTPLNLYDPANMALAWRIVRWASGITDGGLCFDFVEWWASESLHDLEPANAQAAWLDKILELAVEAGLVPAEVE